MNPRGFGVRATERSAVAGLETDEHLVRSAPKSQPAVAQFESHDAGAISVGFEIRSSLLALRSSVKNSFNQTAGSVGSIGKTGVQTVVTKSRLPAESLVAIPKPLPCPATTADPCCRVAGVSNPRMVLVLSFPYSISLGQSSRLRE